MPGVAEKQTWSWDSAPLQGRTMHMARWGHFGVPVLLFPTAGGDFEECERFLMIRALAPLVDAGRIKVYSIGSISSETWLDRDQRPWHKSWLQERYCDFVRHEVLPRMSQDSGGTRGFVAAGASLGAYNTVLAAARDPAWFSMAIAMSGTYDFDRWMGGHRDREHYLTQPLYFLPNVPEGPLLDQLRQVRFIIASGKGRAEAPWESERLVQVLAAKGIPHHLELWGEDVHHDWPTWRTMLPLFLDKLL
ncbi:MAG: hypothetical protein H6742_15080 [Alphaproteobacteria bacterium]|nr:hypothetical protein [Alphaproteobacteria bacterium]